MRKWTRWVCWLVIGFLYLGALAAPFIAPYSARQQFRDFSYHPPIRLHFRDTDGRWHWRPFVYRYEPLHSSEGYRKTAERSEEHTSELQSRPHLVCRLLLEKKKKKKKRTKNKKKKKKKKKQSKKHTLRHV